MTPKDALISKVCPFFVDLLLENVIKENSKRKHEEKMMRIRESIVVVKQRQTTKKGDDKYADIKHWRDLPSRWSICQKYTQC